MLKRLARFLLLSALLVPTLAHADTLTIVLALAEVIGSYTAAVAIVAFVAAYGFSIAVIALNVYGASASRRKAHQEADRARAEYNSNLIDRVATLLAPNPAWRIVYGRCIAGGDIVAVFTSDKTALRQDGTSYTRPDAYKHLVVHVATHEVQAINDVLINGVRVGTLDGSGWVVSTSFGTGTGYQISSARLVGATSIPVALGTGTILAGDEISFTGDSTRYPVTVGITAAGQTLTIAAPGLLQDVGSGTDLQVGNEYAKARDDTRTGIVPAGGSLVVPQAVVTLLSANYVTGSGQSFDMLDLTSSITFSAPRTTIFNASANPATIMYTVRNITQTVRISKHLGTAGQTVDTYLNGLFPTAWDANHVLSGMAYVVITLDLEDVRFQGGPPPIAFDVSGKKLYDPRSSTTAYSNNNALAIRDYLLGVYGFECQAADVNDTYVIAAANACDVATTFSSLDSLGATVTRSLPLYTLNGSFTTADSPESILDRMAESMAGYAMYGGEWLIVPGTWTTSAMDLTDDDLDGQISIIQAGAGMDTLFNGAHASFLQFGRTSPSEIVPYQNATFLATDGRELWSDYTLPFTDDAVRAQNLVRIFTERNRDGLVISYPAKLKGFRLRVGDRVRVSSGEYGFSLKYFRVTDWQFGINTAVNLTLQEDGSTVYDQANATSSDPQPNTQLVNPFVVKGVSGLTVTSGTATLTKLADGSIVPNMHVTWTLPDTPYLSAGGSVEIAWQIADGLNPAWNLMPVSGIDVSADISGVREGSVYIIRATVINSLPVRSQSLYVSHRVVGKSAPPGNVAGLAAANVNGDVVISWTPNTEVDYERTELRRGASYAAGTVISTRPSNPFMWSYPGAATYTIWAVHYDTSGNASTAQSTSVVVTAPTLAGLDAAAATALANIASDNILSSGEKPAAVQKYAQITAEQAGIDAGATALGITTEKTTYDTAVTALTTYLGTLSGWNTIPGVDVVIVGTTFATKFNDVAAARTALLNKIDAVAATLATWSLVNGAGKPADYATADVVLVSAGTTPPTISGNKAVKVGGATAWDSSVYSTDSYVGGAFASAIVADITVSSVMHGLNTDPLTDNSYTSIDYAWYQSSPGGGLYVFEGGANILGPLTFAVGDVLSILYDGVSVTYLQNGVVKRVIAAPPNLKLYLDTSFNNPNSVLSNLRFGPLSNAGVMTTANFVEYLGSGNYLFAGNRLSRTIAGGVGSFSDAASSKEGYKGGASCSFVVDPTTYYIAGLTDDRSGGVAGSTGYFFISRSTTALTVRVLGTETVVGTAATGDILGVTYDGLYVRFYQNGSLVAVRSAPPAMQLWFATGIVSSYPTQMGSVQFGPYTAINIAALPNQPQGGALNSDPECTDITAWNKSGTVARVLSSSPIVGLYALQFTGASGYAATNTVPLSPGKNYRASCFLRWTTTGSNTIYLRIECYNAAGTLLAYNIGVEAVSTTSGWTRYQGTITPPAGTVYGFASIVSNNVGSGVQEAQDIRLEEVVNTDLIVPNAATEVYVSSVASSTITSLQGTPNNLSRYTGVATVTFTPSASGIATLNFSGQIDYTEGNTTIAQSSYVLEDAGATWSASGQNFMTLGVAVPRNTSVRQPVTMTRRIAVTGGVSYTMGFYCNKLNTSDTVTVTQSELRVEVIKR